MGQLPRLGALVKAQMSSPQRNQSKLWQELYKVCWDDLRLSRSSSTTDAVRQELALLTGKVQYSQPVMHDAQEFLTDLLGQLSQEAHALFRFRVQRQLCCASCGAMKDPRVQEEFVLQLHPKDREQTFAELMASVQETALVPNVDCERCRGKRLQMDTVQFALGAHQRYMILSVSTFGVDSNQQSRRLDGRKIQGFQANKTRVFGSDFRAVAAIEHTGNTPYSGHYVCWARHDNPSGWTLLHDDDSKWWRELKRFVMNLKDVCLLFMEKI